MDVIKSTLKSEVTYSTDHTHRLLLKKEWNTKLPKATIITKYPRHQGDIKVDTSTMLITNALYEMGYGTAFMVNLFTHTEIADSIDEIEELIHEEADDYILKAATASDIVIFAWGSSSTKLIDNRINEIKQLLDGQLDKVSILVNPDTNKITHPLNPRTRAFWSIQPLSKIKGDK